MSTLHVILGCIIIFVLLIILFAIFDNSVYKKKLKAKLENIERAIVAGSYNPAEIFREISDIITLDDHVSYSLDVPLPKLSCLDEQNFRKAIQLFRLIENNNKLAVNEEKIKKLEDMFLEIEDLSNEIKNYSKTSLLGDIFGGDAGLKTISGAIDEDNRRVTHEKSSARDYQGKEFKRKWNFLARKFNYILLGEEAHSHVYHSRKI